MATPFVISLTEGTTPVYSATLVGEDGNAVSAAAFSAARLTITYGTGGTVVNDRDGQNVLNANGVTISAGGEVEWKIAENDTIAVVDNPGQWFQHRAVFVLEWDDGDGVPRQLVREILLAIRHVPHVAFEVDA